MNSSGRFDTNTKTKIHTEFGTILKVDIYTDGQHFNEKTETLFDPCHIELIDKLIPFYGKTRAEVIQNLTIRWLEQNFYRLPMLVTAIQNRKGAPCTEAATPR